MHKINCVIALLISICVLFCSCSQEVQPISEANKSSTVSTYTESESTAYTEEEISTTTDNTQIGTTAKATTKPKQKATKKTTQKAEKTTNKATKKITNATTVTTSNTTVKHSESISATEKKQETTLSTTVAETKTETTTTSCSEITCDILIECSKILDHMDNLKAGHDSYVPSDGIILDTYTVTLPSGSTAYDALEKACSDNDININAQKTAYGIYVAGINNLDEKDCGKSSGWLYSVNDKFPPKSCGTYKLSKGDKVVFSYTC